MFLCYIPFFLHRDEKSLTILEEVPLNLLHEIEQSTGHKATAMVVLVLEYGANFSGAGEDTFRTSRAVGSPDDAHLSNFLHPVFYHYAEPLNGLMPLEIGT